MCTVFPMMRDPFRTMHVEMELSGVLTTQLLSERVVNAGGFQNHSVENTFFLCGRPSVID